MTNAKKNTVLSELFKNRIFNTILFFLYLFVYNWFMFMKEEGFTIISLFLVSTFTFIFSIGLFNISKILFKLFVLLLLFFFVPVFIANEFLGGLNNSHFMAMFLTDFAESRSYFKVLPYFLFIKTIFLLLPLLYFFRSKLYILNKNVSFSLLVLVFLYSGWKYYQNYAILKNDKTYVFRVFYVAPFRIFSRSITMYNTVQKELQAQRLLYKDKDRWNITSSAADNDIYVFVIGESVRKDFMSIYNSSIKSTPFLDSIPKFQFMNNYSYSFQTLESLAGSFMLDDATKKPYFPDNVITLGKKAGFSTNWISNQGAVGVEDNYIAAMGNQADYTNFVSKGRWNEHVADDKMLDVLKNRLEKNINKKELYFLHMIGSHPDPCDITKNQYQSFVFSENISCYVESIKRTDAFLKRTFQLLTKTNKKFKIVYLSDHGLYLQDKDFVYHRSEYKQNYDVPLIIIDPTLKKNVYINADRNLKDFLIFYTQLLNIKTKNITPSYNFISEDKAPNPFLLYDGKDYRKLKDNPMP